MFIHATPGLNCRFVPEKRERKNFARLIKALEALDRYETVDFFEQWPQLSCDVQIVFLSVSFGPDFEYNRDHYFRRCCSPGCSSPQKYRSPGCCRRWLRRGGPRRIDLVQPAAFGHRGQLRLARMIWLLALRSGAPEAVLQARAQAAFLVLAAASFSIFLVRRRRLHQLRPSMSDGDRCDQSARVGRTFGATRALPGVDLDLKSGVTGLLGPTAPARPRCCACWPPRCRPVREGGACSGLDPEVPAHLRHPPPARLPAAEVGFPRGFTAFAFVDYIALLKEWTSRRRGTRKCAARSTWWGCPTSARSGSGPCPAASVGRVSLAQALLGSPSVLILDEPTTGVDPEQRVTLRTVLAEIARTSIVVLSTHQTEDVAALCERVIVLDRGRVRYDGPVIELTGQAAGLAGRRTGPGRERLLADRHRPATATSAPACGTTSSTSNHPSKTPTCCCAAGQRRTTPPRRWHHDRGAHVRAARNLPGAPSSPRSPPGRRAGSPSTRSSCSPS